MWLLGIELRTSGRAVSALNCCAISPVPLILCFYGFSLCACVCFSCFLFSLFFLFCLFLFYSCLFVSRERERERERVLINPLRWTHSLWGVAPSQLPGVSSGPKHRHRRHDGQCRMLECECQSPWIQRFHDACPQCLTSSGITGGGGGGGGGGGKSYQG
jgi:hypothetical protein